MIGNSIQNELPWRIKKLSKGRKKTQFGEKTNCPLESREINSHKRDVSTAVIPPKDPNKSYPPFYLCFRSFHTIKPQFISILILFFQFVFPLYPFLTRRISPQKPRLCYSDWSGTMTSSCELHDPPKGIIETDIRNIRGRVFVTKGEYKRKT